MFESEEDALCDFAERRRLVEEDVVFYLAGGHSRYVPIAKGAGLNAGLFVSIDLVRIYRAIESGVGSPWLDVYQCARVELLGLRLWEENEDPERLYFIDAGAASFRAAGWCPSRLGGLRVEAFRRHMGEPEILKDWSGLLISAVHEMARLARAERQMQMHFRAARDILREVVMAEDAPPATATLVRGQLRRG